MTSAEYTEKMDRVIQALAMSGLMCSDITDNDLDIMGHTISLAEEIGFLFEAPIVNRDSAKRMDSQKKALATIRTVRRFLRDTGAEGYT